MSAVSASPTDPSLVREGIPAMHGAFILPCNCCVLLQAPSAFHLEKQIGFTYMCILGSCEIHGNGCCFFTRDRDPVRAPGGRGPGSISSSCGRRGNIPISTRKPADAQELLLIGGNRQRQLLNQTRHAQYPLSYTSLSWSDHWLSCCHGAEACRSWQPFLGGTGHCPSSMGFRRSGGPAGLAMPRL